MTITTERIENSVLFIEKLLTGVNPLTEEVLSNQDTLNNPDIIREMFFIREILETARKVGLSKTAKPARTFRPVSEKAELKEVPASLIDAFEYKKAQPITGFLTQFYAPLEDKTIKPLTAVTVNKWLLLSGILKESYDNDLEQTVKVPAKAGEALGISAEHRTDRTGRRYLSITYGKKAQYFLAQNINHIIMGEAPETLTETMSNKHVCLCQETD